MLKKPEAASVAINLLRFGQTAHSEEVRRLLILTAIHRRIPILTDEQYRELLQKAVTEALSYSRPAHPILLTGKRCRFELAYTDCRQIGPELDTINHGGGNAAVEKKLAEISDNRISERAIISNVDRE